ncbi:hypothetical protein [Isoptericola sediminis]|uniref:Uncharacterized protein n=1 Tax=Isoptericola sediminis TaxID=2733572 RepID=A0A849K0H1_9MICO|nr:hypothetical protein [Isoptericola sediminis]NNU26618.1 hypothetical protein [Isoptericola sediminis]
MPTPTLPPAGPTGRPTRPGRRFVHPEPVDLATAWRAEERLAGDPDRPHHWCPDRHGWLLRAGLHEVLEPVLVPDSAGASSFYRFAELDQPVAAALLDRLDDDYLAVERQNDGPTIGTVLRAVVRHPDRLRAHGYVVGPGRCDERVTVEGVLVRTDHAFVLGDHHGPGCQCDELERFVASLGVDDARVPPHEVTRWWGRPGDLSPDGPAEHWYRLWWD